MYFNSTSSSSQLTSASDFYGNLINRLDSIGQEDVVNFFRNFEKKTERLSVLFKKLRNKKTSYIAFSEESFSETIESLTEMIENCINEIGELVEKSLDLLGKKTTLTPNNISDINRAYTSAFKNLENIRQFYNNSIKDLSGDTSELKKAKNCLESVYEALNQNIEIFNRRNPRNKIYTESDAKRALENDVAELYRKLKL